MPDESLDILIRTKADLKGSTEAAGALSQVTDAVKKDGQAMEETAKKATFLNLKKVEMKKLVRELAHEFPLAGMAARAMMNPIVASLTVAIGIFAKAKTSLDAWNKSMDESAAKSAERDFLPGIEAKAASLREAAGAGAAFYRSIEDATKKEDDFTTSLKKAKDALHEYLTAQTEVDNAAEANELSKVDLAQKTGRMSDSQAITARTGIKDKYRHKAEDLKTQAEDIELKNQEAELAHAMENREAIKQAEAAARAKKKGLTARVKQAERDVVKYDDLSKKADENWKKASDEENDTESRWSSIAQSSGVEEANRQLAEARAKTTAAANERKLTHAIKDKSEAIATNAQTSGLPNADADLTLATGRLGTNEATIERLKRENPAMAANVAMRQDARRTASRIQDDTGRVGVASELSEVKKKLEEQRSQLEHHGSEMVKSSGSLGETIIEGFKQNTAELNAVKKELKELIARGRNP